MSATLCIQFSSLPKSDSYEIKFFEAEEWTPDAENQLLARFHEIISLIRGMSASFTVTIQADIKELDQAVFIIKKKLNCPIEINNQKLSIREIEVLGLIMQGYTNEAIAKKLFISFETVRSHRKHILQKTGAKNTAALITYYHQTFFEK